MALPASGPISGSQIYFELFGTNPNNASLGGMIDSSSLSGTNPDAYSDFYSYSALTTFWRSSFTAKSSSTACAYSVSIQLWHDGSFGFPVTGDTVYTNPSGTTTASWSAFAGIRSTSSGTALGALRINVNGTVHTSDLCP